MSGCDNIGMPVGDAQRGFAAAARRDGIELVDQSVAWLNRRGHLGLPDDDRRRGTDAALEAHLRGLGGDLVTLASANATRLRGDFIHAETGTLIEIDESRHFTSFRLQTLRLYPADASVGFDVADYKHTCQVWQRKSDSYFRARAARGFGVGGSSGSGHTTTRFVTLRRQRWAILR
jgi:hypothetical protein